MMADYLRTLERVMNADFAGASREEKDRAISEVIKVCSIAAGAVTIQPIPLVDSVLITPIQMAEVQAIGRVHGYSLDKRAVMEMLSTFGASVLAQNLIMAAAKLVPFLGWLVTMSMAYGLTWAVGEVSAHYFENGRKVDKDELKAMFRAVYQRRKSERQRRGKAAPSLKEQLMKLRDAFEDGDIDKAEFERRKQDLLSRF